MAHTIPQPITELQAFCANCPAAQEVTALLAELGFRLAFQMEEQRDHSGQLPPLPAQYHFKDEASGTEVIFLAGRDFPMNEDGGTLPPHASRFWLYVGAGTQAFGEAMTILARAYRLTWQNPSTLDSGEREEVA